MLSHKQAQWWLQSRKCFLDIILNLSNAAISKNTTRYWKYHVISIFVIFCCEVWNVKPRPAHIYQNIAGNCEFMVIILKNSEKDIVRPLYFNCVYRINPMPHENSGITYKQIMKISFIRLKNVEWRIIYQVERIETTSIGKENTRVLGNSKVLLETWNWGK